VRDRRRDARALEELLISADLGLAATPNHRGREGAATQCTSLRDLVKNEIRQVFMPSIVRSPS